MLCVGEYVDQFEQVVLEDTAYLKRVGSAPSDLFTSTSNDIATILGLEFSYADNAIPVETVASSTDASHPTPGLGLAFSRFYGQAIHHALIPAYWVEVGQRRGRPF